MRAPLCLLPTLFFVLSCGAKTGLPVPVIEECTNLELQRPNPQVLFAIDRSGSMDFSLDGTPRDDRPGGIPSRWELMGDALGASLAAREFSLDFGMLFFPELVDGDESACGGAEFVSVEPGDGTIIELSRVFRETMPIGGTPSGSALRVAREYFAARGDEDTIPFVVLVTDGAPNCNPEPAIPPPMCRCTSPAPERCDPFVSEDAALHCLDDTRALEEIELLADSGVPVYVLGITREEALADVLDRLAVAGGRPRMGGERQFYDARTERELGEALDAITSSITSCAFSLRPPPDLNRVQVFLGDEELARDPSRSSGWDFSQPDGSVISLYGDACRRIEAGDLEARAELFCDVEPDAGVEAGVDGGGDSGERDG